MRNSIHIPWRYIGVHISQEKTTIAIIAPYAKPGNVIIINVITIFPRHGNSKRRSIFGIIWRSSMNV